MLLCFLEAIAARISLPRDIKIIGATYIAVRGQGIHETR
jgi:hypothetical protein